MRAALWLRWIACGLVGALAASCGRSGACEGTAEFACMQCCTDNGAAAECHDGQWRCPAGFVDPTTCNQDCNPPPSSMRLCVEPDAGVCLDNCGNQEVCIAVPACSSDGGPCIGTDGGGVFEARCHRHCDSYDRCSPQEVCRRYVPASCAPGSTAPYVCCGPGSCPP